MANAIVVKELVKRYGSLYAVDHISFEVTAGECFGSLGPNGAGKTTLIRMLTGLIRKTEGEAFVAGHNVTINPDQVRRAIGVVSQAMTTDLDLSGWENLDIYARYYEVPLRERKARIGMLLDLIGLAPRAGDLVATYSGGMRRRLEIARGLIHHPRILFLDEPTIGLDPQSRRVVWELLQQFRREEELTVFLTTHYMDEADLLCDRIAIIDNGKIITMNTPENLKKEIPGNDIINVTFEGGNTNEQIETIIGEVESLPFVHQVIRHQGGKKNEPEILNIYSDNGAQAIPILLKSLQVRGMKVLAMGLKQQTLEDVFIHYTGRSIRSEGGQKVNYLIGAGLPRRWGN
ncbi:MAG: ATP-binding cassette domain-containing protein [Nitrospira sp.]|nr:ATP-binding cassette domain-containing protein [Candidatus Manganitrophaceae bacterium]HIL34605.1 ATP-binding cassette domain-containing protein [Candidatus Manganitrophaceae bacterium]